jgi:hypothetical protein
MAPISRKKVSTPVLMRSMRVARPVSVVSMMAP